MPDITPEFLRDALHDGDFEIVFQYFTTLTEKNTHSDWSKAAASQIGIFASLRKDFDGGILTYEMFKVERTKVHKSLFKPHRNHP